MVSVEIIAIDKAPSCDWITIFPLYQNFNRFVSILAYKHAHTHTTEWGLLSLLVRSLSHFTWVEFLFVCDSYVVYVSISCALSLSFHLSRDFSRVLVSTDKYTDYAHTIRPIDWEKWREEKNPFDWNDDSPFFSLTNCLNLAKKTDIFCFVWQCSFAWRIEIGILSRDTKKGLKLCEKQFCPCINSEFYW